MQAFDINKIKVAKQPISTEKALTGEYMTEQPVNAPANAEIEKNEYVKDPSGVVTKAAGEKHEKGGIKVNLEDGTEILSDSLKLSSANVKYLSRVFDIDLSTKDTYAKAVDKYTKKIGLAKLNSEQEDLFATMKKEIEKVATDPNTKQLNNDYLSAKIYEVEKKKEPLKQERKRFFDYLFDLQEASKPEEATNQHFKYGGVSKEEFEGMLQKHGITYEEGIEMLGKMPKYDFGGIKGKEGDDLAAKWNNDEEAYKKYVKTAELLKGEKSADFRKKLWEQYQKDIEDKGNYTKGRKESFYKDLKSVKDESELVDQLLAQEERNARLKAHGVEASTTSNAIEKGQYTNKETLEKIKNTPGLADLKFDKGHIGQAGYISYMNLTQPGKLKGYRQEQTGKADELSTFAGKVSGIDANSTNTTLGQFLNLNLEDPAEPAPKEEPKGAGETPVTDKVNPYVRPKNPKFFFQPDAFALPPNAQSPETMVQNRFGRVDPIRIGIENNLQAQSNARQEASKQLEGLPPSQRAAALANILAVSGEQENQAIFQANVTNAQNISNAEQFNIGQADREDIARSQNLLGYEQRALTAQDKTRQDLRNYLDFQSNKSLNNFQNQQRLNLINGMFPDFELDNYGMAVNYDPSRQWSVEDRDKMLRMNMPAYTSPVETNNQNTQR
jgi:hypothetical protein